MLKEKLKDFETLVKKENAFNHAVSMLHWDMETEAPEKAIEKIGETIEFLVGENLTSFLKPQVKEMLDYLHENKNDLDEITNASVQELIKNYNKIIKIPTELMSKYEGLKSKSQSVWAKAKNSNNFEEFAPYLEELIEYNMKFIEYRGYEGHPYNTLLDDYEPGMTVEKLDEFFGYLKENLIPVINIGLENSKKINDDFLSRSIDIDRQKKFSDFLAKYINFDFSKGLLKESVHPFTLNFSKNDVRITTHYYSENISSSIFSTLHEGGHGLYEQNISDKLDKTPVGGGVSMGIHESQSRLYENVLGRSYYFWKGIYPKLQETAPELSDISLEDFHKSINKAKADFIRVEADELTYTLHIMIRYEIEKLIFNKEVEIKDLPRVWNEKVKEYLGLEVPNNSQGILQDVHWAAGLFGYFPSYALGNAYASQVEAAMRRDLDLDDLLLKGDFDTINTYLTKHIHQHGKMLKPEEIIKNMTGEGLNPRYYVDYLESKYKLI